MALKKQIRTSELKSKRDNDPQSPPSDNIERYMITFLNRSIAIKRGIGDDLNVFGVENLFEKIGWSSIYNMKKATYPSFIRMFFANIRITYEPRIMSSLQNKLIKFNCEMMANIIGISNDGPYI